MLGYFFVVIQIAMITVILMTGSFYCSNGYLGIIQLCGVALGLWAIISMRIDNFNITPAVKQNAKLVIRGPYKYIRHPMYTSLWLLFIPLVINYYSPLRLLLLVIFIVDLVAKAYFEEGLLSKKFAEYDEYKGKSKRFIPFVF